MLSAFHCVVVFPPAEDNNTEQSQDEYEADEDGGEDDQVTVVQADGVEHLEESGGEVGGGVAVTNIFTEIRGDPGGGRGGLCGLVPGD